MRTVKENLCKWIRVEWRTFLSKLLGHPSIPASLNPTIEKLNWITQWILKRIIFKKKTLNIYLVYIGLSFCGESSYSGFSASSPFPKWKSRGKGQIIVFRFVVQVDWSGKVQRAKIVTRVMRVLQTKALTFSILSSLFPVVDTYVRLTKDRIFSMSPPISKRCLTLI